VNRVAVFGNAGAGKSTLARRIAEITGLPLYPLDLMQWRRGGAPVPHAEYLEAHAKILKRERWIIDGFGCVPSAWERFAVADTLIYIDLPLATHYWWVTKRFAKGLFKNPAGWPEESPLWSSTMSSYRVVLRCHRGLTPRYRKLVAETVPPKQAHHLRSPAAISAFLEAISMAARRSPAAASRRC
jgi:adenylate kinase family enzyme